MNAETLKALKASIAHWQRFAAGKQREGESIFSDDCELCDLFFQSSRLWKCQGCPVAEKSLLGNSLVRGILFVG
jgi:hypothetical protein